MHSGIKILANYLGTSRRTDAFFDHEDERSTWEDGFSGIAGLIDEARELQETKEPSFKTATINTLKARKATTNAKSKPSLALGSIISSMREKDPRKKSLAKIKGEIDEIIGLNKEQRKHSEKKIKQAKNGKESTAFAIADQISPLAIRAAHIIVGEDVPAHLAEEPQTA